MKAVRLLENGGQLAFDDVPTPTIARAEILVKIRSTVIATASGEDEAYVNSIGASRVIDYREAQFEKVLREKVDVVFDLVGGDTQQRSFLVLKEGGHLVAATQPVSQEETARPRV